MRIPIRVCSRSRQPRGPNIQVSDVSVHAPRNASSVRRLVDLGSRIAQHACLPVLARATASGADRGTAVVSHGRSRASCSRGGFATLSVCCVRPPRLNLTRVRRSSTNRPSFALFGPECDGVLAVERARSHVRRRIGRIHTCRRSLWYSCNRRNECAACQSLACPCRCATSGSHPLRTCEYIVEFGRQCALGVMRPPQLRVSFDCTCKSV